MQMRLHNFKRQAGFMLEALGLSIMILSIVGLLAMVKKVNEELDSDAVRYGKSLLTVRNYSEDYLVTYYSDLLGLADISDPMTVTTATGATITIAKGGSPTIDELRQLGKSLPDMLPTAPGGGFYAIQIEKSPAGCIAANCNLEGLVTITKPYINQGAVDFKRLAIAVGAVGADGASSRMDTPTILTGYAGKWSVVNPVTGQPAGILAARFGYSSSMFSTYYKRDGSTPLTGDMNADGHAMKGVTTFTADGKVTGGKFFTVAHSSGEACSSSDENAFSSGAMGTMMVCQSGQWKSIRINPVALGSGCAQDGKSGTEITTDENLICKNGIYIRVKNLLSRNVTGHFSVVDGSAVAIPACEAGGAPDNALVVNSNAVDIARVPPILSMDSYVTQSGSNWIVTIRLIDASGNVLSGNVLGIRGTLTTECKY